jgi:hypothetical protein
MFLAKNIAQVWTSSLGYPKLSRCCARCGSTSQRSPIEAKVSGQQLCPHHPGTIIDTTIIKGPGEFAITLAVGCFISAIGYPSVRTVVDHACPPTLPSVTDSGRSAIRYDLEADGKGQREEHLPCLDRAPFVTGRTNQWGVSDLL